VEGLEAGDGFLTLSPRDLSIRRIGTVDVA